MKQVGDNAKSDLNLGDKFKSVTETNGFLTKYCVTDEFKSCPKQIRNHFLHHTNSGGFPWWKMKKCVLLQRIYLLPIFYTLAVVSYPLTQPLSNSVCLSQGSVLYDNHIILYLMPNRHIFEINTLSVEAIFILF